LLNLLRRFNNVNLVELEAAGYLPLLFNQTRIGTISPTVLKELNNFNQVFRVHEDKVVLSPDLDTFEKRSESLRKFFEEMRGKHVFESLSGWRDECYETRLKFSQKPIFKVERAGTPVLGLKQYGVHINGYVQSQDGRKSIWLQKRSKTKQTYPGKLDSLVGGGLTVGLGVMETAVKELNEEAGLDLHEHQDKALQLLPRGSVTFFHQSTRGLHPQTEFVFDLQVPDTFSPQNKDGEVEDFMLVSSEKLINLLQTEDYKTTSIPIALDWLVRHGLLTAETEPDISEILSEIHTPLHKLYGQQGNNN